MASTRHTHFTSRVSFRLARRPSTQFANSTISVQRNTRFLRTRRLFKRRSATALLQVKQGYWSYKPPSRRTYKIRRYNLLNARKQRNHYCRAMYKERVLNQEFTFFWFTSSGFRKRPILFEVLAPASFFLRGSHMRREYQKRTSLHSESSTSKGLLYAPDPDNCKKGMLSDQPRLSRVSSMAILCCLGCSHSKI